MPMQLSADVMRDGLQNRESLNLGSTKKSSAHFVARFLAALLVFAQFGCEIFHGPTIVNRSSVPLSVAATISGRVVECELQPGNRLLQRARDQKLEALQVSDGVRRWSFSSADIGRALTESGDLEQAVIELHGEQIRGTSIKR